MTEEEVLQEFRDAGALLTGHFVLSSGKHSDVYFNKSIVGMYPERVTRLCAALADRVREQVSEPPAYVLSPVAGAVVFGFETARHLDVPFMFLERADSGQGFELRRGFALPDDAPVLIVEDIVSTGKSAREAVAGAHAAAGRSVAVACLVDRSAEQVDLGPPLIALARLRAPVYDPGALPPHLKNMPLTAVGSRPSARRKAEGAQAPRLGVNIDHVATVRNARGGVHPDPVRAAKLAAEAGADGITVHLREDRRHIRDEDLARLREEIDIPLNLEMAAVDEMRAIALRARPHAVCVVPEKREERTTEGGLDVVAAGPGLGAFLAPLRAAGCRVSLFIEPAPAQIAAAAAAGADIVEFHTGRYCEASGEARARELAALREGARTAAAAGLEVHMGHGLTYDTVGPVAAIKEVAELNIGHFLIGEAVFVGMKAVVDRMRAEILRGRMGAA